MPTQENYDDHNWVVRALEKRQDADRDARTRAREAHEFVDLPNGHWEDSVWQRSDGHPRYQFDLVGPILEQVCNDIDASDFDIKISPAGGDATKATAKTYDGIVRNIETISGASATYSMATRNVATGGLDGWRIRQAYADDNSFHQDLLIEDLPNYMDRVWHGPHQKPDASDSEYCFVMTWLDKDDYEAAYKDRPEASLSANSETYSHLQKQDLVAVGEFYYLKETTRDLVLMSNDSTYEDDDDFKKIVDELLDKGIKEVERRKRTKRTVCIRKFDAKGWIDESSETVFENWIPVVPLYGNWKINDNEIRYKGEVEALMDPQRVFDYSKSREIEEGALAPREKILATEKQAEGHEKEWAELNTSADPVMYWTPDPDVPGDKPSKILGAQINPGLTTIGNSMQEIIGHVAGKFAASMGDNPNLQSGKAIEALQERGDAGNNKYIAAREVAQRHTGRILVNAIPRVYAPGRQVRLLKEDNSYDMAIIGEVIEDRTTKELVTINDLSTGTYDVMCTSGPSFKNRQNETVKALTEIGGIMPSVMEAGADVMVANINSPGMEQVAKRMRKQAFMEGRIDEEDMTPEELQMAEQMKQQPPQEDPNMVLARAEEGKAQADLVAAQTDQQKAVAEVQDKRAQREIDKYKAETERMKAEVDRDKVAAEIEHKNATTDKARAEAHAQVLENMTVENGIAKLLEALNNATA